MYCLAVLLCKAWARWMLQHLWLGASLLCYRYFQCPPKFGLFAPIHKVIRIGFPSTSPAKAKKSKRMAMGVSALTHSPSSSSISSVSSVASSVGGRPSRSGLVSGLSHRLQPPSAAAWIYKPGRVGVLFQQLHWACSFFFFNQMLSNCDHLKSPRGCLEGDEPQLRC